MRARPIAHACLAGVPVGLSEALKVPYFVRFFAVAAFGAAFLCATLRSQAAEPILLRVDAAAAPAQNVVTTHETIPVQPGKVTLYYPKWLPGQHQPVGPIANMAGLVIKGGGSTLQWRREPTDLYAIDVQVPAGVNSLDIDMTYLGATFGRYSSSRVASPNLLVVTWDENLLYPSTGTIQNTMFRPTVVLPAANWQYATALPGGRRDGNAITFDDVSLEHLIDAPLDAGVNYRRWPLWSGGGASAYLNVFADTPEELNVSDATIAHYRRR